jgi:hypothetical protein
MHELRRTQSKLGPRFWEMEKPHFDIKQNRLARARSIALGNLEPAECQPELTIAFERIPLFADENKR